MSDAPDRIWARYSNAQAHRGKRGIIIDDGPHEGATEFAPAALIAAAYEAAVKVAEKEGLEQEADSVGHYIAIALRALTPSDAQAALDARDARIRREERERAVSALESLLAGAIQEDRERTDHTLVTAGCAIKLAIKTIRAMGDE